jgi:hypothetical protein
VAKKPQTPRPPVQAPKRREEKASGLRGLPTWALVVAGLAAVGVVVLVVIAATGGGGGSDNAATNDSELKATMTAAGCTLRDVKPFAPKDGQNYHNDSPTLTSKVRWSTDPPSAGGHYPLWAVWNFYRSPLNPRQVVHNEEHGGVIMWWGPKVPAATVDKLEAFYRESPDSMVGTPYAKLGNRIALTAWTLDDPSQYYRKGQYGTGHIAICTKFDEDAFTAFRDAFRGQGPERGTDNSAGSGPGG